jgi:hypothetical protein
VPKKLRFTVGGRGDSYGRSSFLRG